MKAATVRPCDTIPNAIISAVRIATPGAYRACQCLGHPGYVRTVLTADE